MFVTFKPLLLLAVILALTSCDKLKGPTEAEQIERTIRQEVQRNQRGLNALTEVATTTPFDGFAWRRGELLQIRQRVNGTMQLLSDVEVPAIIATAVEFNVPSFSIVRYQEGWLVVFRNYVSEHCQAVYAYAYRGNLPETPQCHADRFANEANGQCQSPINTEWVIFKEWFFAESLAEQGNPVCVKKANDGWQAEAQTL